ncbi:MAG: peptide chain release factor N(5)-glutamine methyltransferase [Rhodobacteraceae bacterium]|uniref:peptide chain release factor N(5)-glutamine methyltransferase n=1 Tax=Albidovulum sp. TaxID=1872424 RepID=UPI001E00BE3F|nr:peptide chain release factor N(5)-glutamine methyltransferase [uncultured Defluviimonas sp.]MCB2124143.1 peptide chain release factor N(5)-glutamine methyltransferase [Paracoccaceae bacterium]MCC0068610.1 peptide chain release factor N(5)-glutamine methyltransferase [Paracoccaceae bacterium]
MTGAEALADAVRRLKAAGIDSAAGDARRLLAHALGVAPDRVTLVAPEEMPPEAEARFLAAVAARAARQPVAQITGTRDFFGRSFLVTRDTLDPRPETELLVAAALERPFVKMLDLGTGTGCILLSCLAGMPVATGTGTDVSAAALEVARENARRLGLSGRARFLAADWFAAVPGKFDLIVSNPPYIAEAEMAGLAPEVRDWEPRGALTPGGDGLDAHRAIAAGAGARLMAGGRLILEIGPTQAAAVSALLVAEGFAAPEVRRDLDGRDRVVIAAKGGDGSDCGAA